jgi:hypothetical protein
MGRANSRINRDGSRDERMTSRRASPLPLQCRIFFPIGASIERQSLAAFLTARDKRNNGSCPIAELRGSGVRRRSADTGLPPM